MRSTTHGSRAVSETAASTPAPSEPSEARPIDGDTGPIPAQPTANTAESIEASASVNVPCHGATAATPATPRRRKRAKPAWTARQSLAIEAEARGDDPCTAEGVQTPSGRPLPRSTLRRWRALAGWADAILAVRVADRRALHVELAAGDLDAVRRLRQTVNDPTVDPTEASSAARALLSTRPGERYTPCRVNT